MGLCIPEKPFHGESEKDLSGHRKGDSGEESGMERGSKSAADPAFDRHQTSSGGICRKSGYDAQGQDGSVHCHAYGNGALLRERADLGKHCGYLVSEQVLSEQAVLSGYGRAFFGISQKRASAPGLQAAAGDTADQ